MYLNNIKITDFFNKVYNKGVIVKITKVNFCTNSKKKNESNVSNCVQNLRIQIDIPYVSSYVERMSESATRNDLLSYIERVLGCFLYETTTTTTQQCYDQWQDIYIYVSSTTKKKSFQYSKT